MNFLGQVSLGVFFLLFPNGRLVPRWMGLILLLVILRCNSSAIFPSTRHLSMRIGQGGSTCWCPLVVFGAIIYSQIYRYRRVSTPVQRQQTKWIILGVAVAIGVVIGILAIAVLIPSIDCTKSFGVTLLVLIIWPVALLLIPLSIGFSILRYRLYDIDLLINRTLVYGTLTVSAGSGLLWPHFCLAIPAPGDHQPE